MARRGMSELREIADDLEAVVEQIRGSFRPAKVILFRWYASDRARPESDVDLLVITSEPPGWREGHRFAMELESRFRLRLHIQFMREEEFEETRDVVGGLAFPASRAGKVLYDQHSSAG
jgi:predicted nucleotidyltransferase